MLHLTMTGTSAVCLLPYTVVIQKWEQKLAIFPYLIPSHRMGFVHEVMRHVSLGCETSVG